MDSYLSEPAVSCGLQWWGLLQLCSCSPKSKRDKGHAFFRTLNLQCAEDVRSQYSGRGRGLQVYHLAHYLCPQAPIKWGGGRGEREREPCIYCFAHASKIPPVQTNLAPSANCTLKTTTLPPLIGAWDEANYHAVNRRTQSPFVFAHSQIHITQLHANWKCNITYVPWGHARGILRWDTTWVGWVWLRKDHLTKTL